LPDDGSAFFSLRKSICDKNQHRALIAHSHALLVCLFVFLFFSLQPSFLKLSSHILRFFINVVAMCGHCLFFSSSSSEETNRGTLAAVVCDVKSSRALSVGRTSITIPFKSSK
jgi:Mn2+/Fe2+ NRAMP family transporter